MKPHIHIKRKLQAQYEGFLKTPSLFKDSFDDLDFFHVSQNTPRQTTISENFTIPESIRLGQRMEYYFQEALNESKDYYILAKNLQIVHNKKTLGEIDFLIKDLKTGQVQHIEMAYKFYLLTPDKKKKWPKQWQGANLRDSLHKKLKKIKNNQLPLLFKNECQSYLKKLQLQSTPITQKICLKGQLFLPLGYTGSLPDSLNLKAIVGNWLRFDQLKKVGAHKALVFIPPKNDWVTIPHHSWVQWLDFETAQEILKQMNLQQEATLVWLQFPGGELQRHFIVGW